MAYTIAFGATTLADLSAGDHFLIEDMSLRAVEQVDELAFADYASRIMRGNKIGVFAFVVSRSFATGAASATAYKAAEAMVGTSGTLVATVGAVSMTMAGANLKEVERVKWDGVRLAIRYRFSRSTMT